MPDQQLTYRLLELVPILYSNPGIRLETLIELTGHSDRRALVRDLKQLAFFCAPPYSPGDYIEIDFNNDEVTLRLPLGLDRPFNLDSDEWCALLRSLEEGYALLEHEAQFESLELLRALIEQLSPTPLSYEPTDFFSQRRELLQEAIDSESMVEFLYHALSSGSDEIRRVEPWAIFTYRGTSYLLGHCLLRCDTRIFHLDRMSEVNLLQMARSVTPPTDLRQEINHLYFDNRDLGFSVIIAYEPQIESALDEQLQLTPLDPEKLRLEQPDLPPWPEHFIVAQSKVRERNWFRATIRGYLEQCLILSPDHLRQSFLEELDQIEKNLNGVLL